MSDVVVAQSRNNVLVWYFIDSPDKVTIIPVKGDVEQIERVNGQTNILVTEGTSAVPYQLDEVLIEFGASFENRDYERAIHLLEKLEWSEQVDTMWRNLGKLALEDGNVLMAERCYAETGDISAARFLRNFQSVIDSERYSKLNDYTSKIKIAILNNQFKEAENLHLQYGQVEEAINMYQDMHKWDLAIRVAEFKNHPDLVHIKESYHQWLIESGQEEKVGMIKEQEGNYVDAVNIYLKGGIVGKAAQVVIKRNLYQNKELAEKVTKSLVKSRLFEKAGELYELLEDDKRALETYKEGNHFKQALAISRKIAPDQIVILEEKWGDYLLDQKKTEQSINHFIEAGKPLKALKAAMQGKLYIRADAIIQTLPSPKQAQQYLDLLAEHFQEAGEYELAEKYFTLCQKPNEALKMYMSHKMYEKAYQVAKTLPENHNDYFTNAAKQLVQEGNLRDAERIYLLIKDPDSAISMYKNQKRYQDMIRLVTSYHSDLLKDTQVSIAKALENDGHWKQAEGYYIDSKDWKAAVNMYCINDLFEDAYRVAKTYGGVNTAIQVAFIWAKTLRGDSAFKLLQRLGLLDQVLELAAETGSFEFALELGTYLDPKKLEDLYFKHAMYLEDEGKFERAEDYFIKAKKPKEAILMHVHNEQWERALEVAEKYEPESVGDVLIGQAKICFDRKDYAKMETLLIRSPRPEIAIRFYKDAGMWKEALSFAERHLPSKVAELQTEVSGMSKKESASIHDQYSVAKKFEYERNYTKAVEAYLGLSANTDNIDLAMQGWLKAVDLAGKFMDADAANKVALQVIQKLITAEKYELAGDLNAGLALYEEAAEVYIRGQIWDKARKLYQNAAPHLKERVESAYASFLNRRGDVESLINVDADAGLDILAKKGEWDRCLAVAQKQVSSAIFFRQYSNFIGSGYTSQVPEYHVGRMCQKPKVAKGKRIRHQVQHSQARDLVLWLRKARGICYQ